MIDQLPDYEARLETFYRSFLRPGDVCVDVGAHEGRHLYPMLECIGMNGRALAFEPIPELAAQLAKAVMVRKLDEVVSVHAMALANEKGRTSFVIAIDAPGYSGIRERHYDVATSTQTIEVELSTLDSMVEGQLSKVDYIKIDAEGAEWEIIKGAQHVLESCRPIVSFEFGEASYGAYNVVPEDVYRFFDARRFGVVDILGRRLDCQAFVDSSRRQELWDYVAIPLEKDVAATARVLESD